jgi:hypothetical protein
MVAAATLAALTESGRQERVIRRLRMLFSVLDLTEYLSVSVWSVSLGG